MFFTALFLSLLDTCHPRDKGSVWVHFLIVPSWFFPLVPSHCAHLHLCFFMTSLQLTSLSELTDWCLCV